MARRTLSTLMLVAWASLPLAGCTICQSPEDANYGYFGGVTTRNSPSQGRAGSVLDSGLATLTTVEYNEADEHATPEAAPAPEAAPEGTPGVAPEAVTGY